MYAEARWVWGHAPPGKRFEYNAMRWLLRLFWGPKCHYYSLLLSWHGNKILIHFTFACMEVSIHRRFQSPRELCEGATYTSQSEFSLVFSLIVFRAMPAENVWLPHSKLFVLRSPQLSGPWCSCGHGSVQTINGLLASRQKVGIAISVKTLVRQLPGLPDLLRAPVKWL